MAQRKILAAERRIVAAHPAPQQQLGDQQHQQEPRPASQRRGRRRDHGLRLHAVLLCHQCHEENLRAQQVGGDHHRHQPQGDGPHAEQPLQDDPHQREDGQHHRGSKAAVGIADLSEAVTVQTPCRMPCDGQGACLTFGGRPICHGGGACPGKVAFRGASGTRCHAVTRLHRTFRCHTATHCT